MADFADFALRLAHPQGWGEQMFSLLGRLSGEQSSFTLEGEPIFELLEFWLTVNSGENIGREMTTSKLCTELGAIAASKEIEFIYKGKTRSFAQRLRNIMSTLGEYYAIKEHHGKARTRYLSFRPRFLERELKEQSGESNPKSSPQSPLITGSFTTILDKRYEQLSLESEMGEITCPF